MVEVKLAEIEANVPEVKPLEACKAEPCAKAVGLARRRHLRDEIGRMP